MSSQKEDLPNYPSGDIPTLATPQDNIGYVNSYTDTFMKSEFRTEMFYPFIVSISAVSF